MKVVRMLVALLLPTLCFAEEFFPAGSFSSEPADDARAAASLSSELIALEERPLYSTQIGKDVECYRFTWLRSFHKPVVLRIDVLKNGNATFTVKVAEARMEAEPGKFSRNEVLTIKNAVEQVRATFEGVKFFDLAPNEPEREVMDGSLWLVEAIVNGRYHVVSRRSPESGPVFRIGMHFIERAIGGDLTPIY